MKLFLLEFALATVSVIVLVCVFFAGWQTGLLSLRPTVPPMPYPPNLPSVITNVVRAVEPWPLMMRREPDRVYYLTNNFAGTNHYPETP